MPTKDIATHKPNAIDTGITPAPTNVSITSTTTSTSKSNVIIFSNFSSFNLSFISFLRPLS